MSWRFGVPIFRGIFNSLVCDASISNWTSRFHFLKNLCENTGYNSWLQPSKSKLRYLTLMKNTRTFGCNSKYHNCPLSLQNGSCIPVFAQCRSFSTKIETELGRRLCRAKPEKIVQLLKKELNNMPITLKMKEDRCRTTSLRRPSRKYLIMSQEIKVSANGLRHQFIYSEKEPDKNLIEIFQKKAQRLNSCSKLAAN